MDGDLVFGGGDEEEVRVVALRHHVGRDPVGEGNEEVRSDLKTFGLDEIGHRRFTRGERCAVAPAKAGCLVCRDQTATAARAG